MQVRREIGRERDDVALVARGGRCDGGPVAARLDVSDVARESHVVRGGGAVLGLVALVLGHLALLDDAVVGRDGDVGAVTDAVALALDAVRATDLRDHVLYVQVLVVARVAAVVVEVVANAEGTAHLAAYRVGGAVGRGTGRDVELCSRVGQCRSAAVHFLERDVPRGRRTTSQSNRGDGARATARGVDRSTSAGTVSDEVADRNFRDMGGGDAGEDCEDASPISDSSGRIEVDRLLRDATASDILAVRRRDRAER